jgi:hypothetical protein
MKIRVGLAGLFACCFSAAVFAQPGITGVSFAGTAMSPTGSWASVPSPGYWSIGAILEDSGHHPIGFLSPLTTLNTASAPSFPTGFRVTLGENTLPGVIVVVYRSTTPFAAGDTVDKAEFTGLCPLGCVAGNLFVPLLGDLPNTDFTPGGLALPVKLQEFSVY